MTYCKTCGGECNFPWFYANVGKEIDYVEVADNHYAKKNVYGRKEQLYFCSVQHRADYFPEAWE